MDGTRDVVNYHHLLYYWFDYRMINWQISKWFVHMTRAHSIFYNPTTFRQLFQFRSKRIFQTCQLLSARLRLHQYQASILHKLRLHSRQQGTEFHRVLIELDYHQYRRLLNHRIVNYIRRDACLQVLQVQIP